MKKNFVIAVAMIFVFGMSVAGCGSNNKPEISSEKEEIIEDKNNTTELVVENKEEKEEMADIKFSDEEKSMMAGKTVADTIETEQEKSDSNTLEINGKNIAIYSDVSLNSQNQDTEYSQLIHVTYYSNTCEKERGMNIQIPANYSNEKKYPVLYVLHGIFGDEYSMCGDGKQGIPALIDNMVALNEAEEMIVVYPFMYASKEQDQCTAIDDKNCAAYDNFINELTDEIMSYMKENYSILEGKENTAVTGFSMGGRESLAVGLYRPDLFGYIGAIAPAPGLVPGIDIHLNHPGQFKLEEIAYPDEKHIFIMICSGDKDSVVGTFPRTYHELYDEHEIEHIWWEVPGSDHGDPAISSGIYNFAKYIFK